VLAVGCGGGGQTIKPNVPPAPPKIVVAPPPAFPEGWPYAPGAGTAIGAKGMVVSDASLATKVGQQVLSDGGNAADAAIALAFALAVVLPSAGNLGGGGFLVSRFDGNVRALDFRETAPAKATSDLFVDDKGKPNGAAREGYRASGTPGSVAGLYEAFQTLGSKKKTWAQLIAPAIKLAKDGFVVDAPLAKNLADNKARLEKNPASAAIYLPDGKPLEEGSTLKNPDLAKTLERIAEKGPSGFYTGPTAEAIAADFAAHDGLITVADLAAYKAKWRAPIEFEYRGYKIYSMSPPSSGGATLAMICNVLSGYELKKLEWHSAKELNLTFEAMKRAFSARNARLGDPDFVKNPLDELLSPEWAKKQRATIVEGKSTPASELSPKGPASGNGPHTTHFSVVDSSGSSVALTTTINWWFGNGITVAGGGFLMNNEMDDFASQPGTANAYGLVQGEPNKIVPGKRMLSSMSPTIVVDSSGRVVLVLGAAGGPTIITAVFEILSSVIDHGFDVGVAVNAPRFHQQDLPEDVMYEANGMPEPLKKDLAAMGYTFKERGHIADAPAIGLTDKGWMGAPEPRRPGAYAAGW